MLMFSKVIEYRKNKQNKQRATYQKKKDEIRQQAVDFQREFTENDTCFSWWELAEKGDYFTKQGKRYGLLKEFRENGII